MKMLLTALTLIGALAVALPVASTPASAAFVTKRVHFHYNRFGHGCRTVRRVIHYRNGYNRVQIRRRCR